MWKGKGGQFFLDCGPFKFFLAFRATLFKNQERNTRNTRWLSLTILSTDRTKDLGGPDLARGPHFAHPCDRGC